MYRMDTGAGSAHVPMSKSDTDVFNVSAIETFPTTYQRLSFCQGCDHGGPVAGKAAKGG